MVLYIGQKADEPIKSQTPANEDHKYSTDGSFFQILSFSAVNKSPFLSPVMPFTVFFSFNFGTPGQNERACEKKSDV